jgi:energy-coupling factor transport system permease protein
MGNAVEYLDVASPVHRLNPITKLIGLLCIFSVGIIFSNPLVLTILIGFIYLLFLASKAGRIFIPYFKLTISVGLFMLVLQVLFAHDGPELFRFIPSRIPVLGWMGSVNRDSLWQGLTMVARMGVFSFSLPLLLATTQPRDLVLVLVEKLKFPYQYAFMFITALRFIPTLFVEIENILQAQTARAFEVKSKNPWKQLKAYLPLVVPLVMIALKKAERLAVAMETRGYGLGPRTYLRKPVFRFGDLGVCVGLAGIVFLSIWLRISGWGA